MTVPGAIPAIISIKDYEKAQTRSRSNHAKNPGGKVEFPLAWKLVCGSCGYSLTREQKTSTCCCKRKKYTDDAGCLNDKIDMAIIEKSVMAAIQKLYELCDQRNKETSKRNDSEGSELLRKIRETELCIRMSLDNKIDLYNNYCDDKLSKKEYLLMRDSEDLNLQKAENELAELMQRQTAVNENKVDDLCKEICALPVADSLTKEITDALIKRVLVYASDRIEIEWAFVNPF